MSNFNYCFLVWTFSTTQSLEKTENFQKKASPFFLNDYESTYEDLPEKFGCPNIDLKSQRTRFIEIFKIFNPGYMTFLNLEIQTDELVKNIS